MKQKHKVFQLRKQLFALEGYSDENTLLYHLSADNDLFISSVKPTTSSDKLSIKILYSGANSEITDEMLDTFLVSSDTSYNPSRPFRWYHFTDGICADTDDEESVKKMRALSYKNLLEKIDTPEYIWIYEVEIVKPS